MIGNLAKGIWISGYNYESYKSFSSQTNESYEISVIDVLTDKDDSLIYDFLIYYKGYSEWKK
ncbi:MAG: hypothetical protein FH753_03270 [Firmicutes bacterium]|nr:hypothetical protein [Bacillota bacterium]